MSEAEKAGHLLKAAAEDAVRELRWLIKNYVAEQRHYASAHAAEHIATRLESAIKNFNPEGSCYGPNDQTDYTELIALDRKLRGEAEHTCDPNCCHICHHGPCKGESGGCSRGNRNGANCRAKRVADCNWPNCGCYARNH